MCNKYWQTLEFPKILDRLAQYTSFSASQELALGLEAVSDVLEARRRQRETSEARELLALKANLSLGGVRDVRPAVKDATLGIVLTPIDLLDIRGVLLRGRTLRHTITRNKSNQFPLLAAKAQWIEGCPHVVAEIARCINDRAEVVDRASATLARIRRELCEAHDRLLDKLQRIITTPANVAFLQEPLITQRGDRYVIPLKTEFKGRIPGLVHDQSASGATVFIEPLVTVELNNHWRELQLEEEREIRRILAELSSLVAAEGPFIERTVEALAELDLAFAKARYAEEIKGVEPKLVAFPKAGYWIPETGSQPPKATEGDIWHPGSCIHLLKARHPLLPPDEVVPIDVRLDKEMGFFILVITGPNTGGKTVSLKTVGLLTLMAQAGLHIPAEEGSTLSIFSGVYADIGDEQSIEQSLSTFSSHMSNIIDILERANSRSLVLLDELGAGTDPAEGSALARALLSFLRGRGVTTLATTHVSELKVYAHATSGVQNACVEFDPETLAPTYELSIGLPGRSNAFAIAARLGLSMDIVEEARGLIAPQSLEAEELLTEIKRARQETLAARQAAQAAQQEAESREQELGKRLAGVEEARRAVLREARDEAQRELEAVREEVRRIQAGLETKTITEEWLAQGEERLAELESRVLPLEPRVRRPADVGPLAPGDIVQVEGLGAVGEVIDLAGNEAEVQIGRFRVRIDKRDLELRQQALPSQDDSGERMITVANARPASPGMELDLRGQTVEEVIPRLDKYLDDASLAGLLWARIIHGKGTGTLRRAVREHLNNHPLVASHRPGDHHEGGDGVTIVQLTGG